MNAIVILNSHGGSAGENASQAVGAALRSADIDAEIVDVDGQDAEQAAASALRSGTDLIIAAGGDGTISAVAAAIAGTSCTLGILPLGTLNHFARDLGIPHDLDGAVQILARNKGAMVDIAEVNGRIFVNNSAIGLYPLMVIDRESQQQRLGRSKRLAMMVAALRTLVRFDRHRLSLTIDNTEQRIDTPLLFVGNNDYRLDLRGAGKRESLSDGRLCVFVLRSAGRLGMIGAAVRALFGHARPDDMIRLDDVKRLRVDSGRTRLALALDGEVIEIEPPLDFRIQPKALRVLTP